MHVHSVSSRAVERSGAPIELVVEDLAVGVGADAGLVEDLGDDLRGAALLEDAAAVTMLQALDGWYKLGPIEAEARPRLVLAE